MFLASGYPLAAAAQTTMIGQINGSTSIVAGSQSPIPLTVTVYYTSSLGNQLIVGILDANLTSPRIVPGIVASSTDSCLNQPEPAALCAISVSKTSGVEVIGFQVGGIFGGRRGPGIWNLNVTSALVDPKGNLVVGSASSSIFQVTLVPVILTVDVPAGVAASVNGVEQSPGRASVGVALGQNNITVPQLVQLNQSSRLMFDYWSDGYPATTRSIVITNTTTLQAVYVTQNLLTVLGLPGNSTENGWYDADASATFSASAYQPMSGLLGALGGRISFEGWYENGQLLTNSPAGTISMDEPHTLTAVWQVDYTIPIIVVIVAVGAVVAIFTIVHRMKSRTPRRRRKSNRKRS